MKSVRNPVPARLAAVPRVYPESHFASGNALFGTIATTRYNVRMSMNIRVPNLQAALDQLRKELAQYRGNSHVTVGIHEGAPQPESGDLTMAQLGAVQHFGTEDGHIPARRWLDVGVESGTQDILDTIRSGAAKGLPLDAVLEQVGAVAAGAVQEYMTDLKTPKNADSTIAKKGDDNPLIDDGPLRAAVTHAVTREKPIEGIG